jgi:hypothetical protein
MISLVKELSEKMLELFIKTMDADNVEFTKRMGTVLNPGMNFYKENSTDLKRCVFFLFIP